MSSANLCELLQPRQEPVPSGQMAAPRPVFHAALGTEIQEIRKAKGWSLNQAVLFAKRKGHKQPTAQGLRWLEEGRTRYPDPDTLKAIADLYGLDYSALALRIAQTNYERDLATYGRDLIRHLQDQGSVHPSHGGTADEFPASARRIAELEKRVVFYETALNTVEDVAKQLLDVVAIRDKDNAARSRAARRSGRSGKAS